MVRRARKILFISRSHHLYKRCAMVLLFSIFYASVLLVTVLLSVVMCLPIIALIRT